jgi:hypothetical protein
VQLVGALLVGQVLVELRLLQGLRLGLLVQLVRRELGGGQRQGGAGLLDRVGGVTGQLQQNVGVLLGSGGVGRLCRVQRLEVVEVLLLAGQVALEGLAGVGQVRGGCGQRVSGARRLGAVRDVGRAS